MTVQRRAVKPWLCAHASTWYGWECCPGQTFKALLLIFLVVALFGAHQPIPDHLPTSDPQLSLLFIPHEAKKDSSQCSHSTAPFCSVSSLAAPSPRLGGLLGAEALRPIPFFISLCGNSSGGFPSPPALPVVPLSFQMMLSCKSAAGQNSRRSERSSLSHTCCKHVGFSESGCCISCL